ncbi:hypothetical protein GCM10023149_31980 [Mucilaginibacter gynuensis]|uniref:Redox-active disulfide protein 2 n=1 Tax=Mucilaginibacter gynuensis TaxID=1302236 RepID=A0ABP8GQG3_9SPHI
MEQLSALSLTELTARRTKLKSILITSITLAVVLLFVYAYLYFFKSKNISIGSLVPLMVLPITWLPIFNSLKSINGEISSRKQDVAANN